MCVLESIFTVFRRFMMRLITRRCVMYTEMLVDDVLIHVDDRKRQSLLRFDRAEHPVVAQIGGPERGLTMLASMHHTVPFGCVRAGEDPSKMARAAKMCEDSGCAPSRARTDVRTRKRPPPAARPCAPTAHPHRRPCAHACTHADLML